MEISTLFKPSLNNIWGLNAQRCIRFFFFFECFRFSQYKSRWTLWSQLSCLCLRRRKWTPAPWCLLSSAAWPTIPTSPRGARSTKRPRTTRPRHLARNLWRYVTKALHKLKYFHVLISLFTYIWGCILLCYCWGSNNKHRLVNISQVQDLDNPTLM